MIAWHERPIEVANLFNPAFCSILIYDAVSGYEEECKRGMPYPLTFLILPIVLHKHTRTMVPKTIRTKLHVWLQKNPEVRIQFAERTRQLVSYTKEAILFGSQVKVLTFSDEGDVIHQKRKMKKVEWPDNCETAICRKKAHFVGRWLAEAGAVTSIYTMWGIRP